MLGITLLFYGVFLLTYFLWFQAGYILQFPHLLRTVSPLMYLTGPFFYFYVRNTLSGRKGLAKKDLVHFVPAILHFIDLMPFYLLSGEEKLEIATLIVADLNSLHWNASGMVDIAFHYMFRLALLLGYYLYALVLLGRHMPFRSQLALVSKHKNWFLLSFYLTGMVILGHSGYEFVNYLSWKGLLSESFFSVFFANLTFLSLIVLILYINFRQENIFQASGDAVITAPSVVKEKELQRTVDNAPPLVREEGSIAVENEISESKELLASREKLLLRIQDRKVFTQKGITLPEFSKSLGLSQKTVSATIHQISGKRFNDWVNTYRVAMAVEKIEEGYLDDYTLESLADLVGFNSRTTFFNAFNKEKGCSPSEYWVKFQNGAY